MKSAVLIVLMVANQGGGPATAEFVSMDACERAKATLLEETPPAFFVRATCFDQETGEAAPQ